MSGIIQMLSTGAAPLPSREYLEALSAGAGTSATFTAVSIGAVYPSRLVVIGLQARSGSLRKANSVTIGGVSAAATRNGSGFTHVSLWTANIPSGTTADVVVTMDGAVDSFGLAVYALHNLESSTPVDSAKASKDVWPSYPPTTVDVTLAVPEGGILIAVNLVDTTQAVSWTGVVEDSDSGGRSSASKQYLPADPTYAISTTLDPGNQSTILAASWR